MFVYSVFSLHKSILNRTIQEIQYKIAPTKMMRDLLQPSFTFNGNQSCKAFLIFISQPPYNSVTNISNLTTSEPSELARINNVTRKAMFPTNSEVIVPVNCYGQGQYY